MPLCLFSCLPILAEDAGPDEAYTIAICPPVDLDPGSRKFDPANLVATGVEVISSGDDVRAGKGGVSTGEFLVAIRNLDGELAVEYWFKARKVAESGGRVVYLYGPDAATVKGVENPAAVARGDGEAPVIVFLLESGAVKKGEYAGTVTINGERFYLLKQ